MFQSKDGHDLVDQLQRLEEEGVKSRFRSWKSGRMVMSVTEVTCQLN